MKWLSISGAALATALVLSACSSGGSAADDETDARTDAVIAVRGEVSALDPTELSTAFTSGGERASAVYGALMKYDEEGGVVPAMAQSLESPDLQVWTLKLREGATFTDGSEFDADAVAYNLDRHTAEDSTSPAKSLLADVESIEVLDPLTIEFTLTRPSGSFASLFTNNTTLGYIVSPAAVEADPEALGSSPVGAGPFMVEEWVRDSHMKVVKNPDYWDAENVSLESIRFETIINEQTRTQSMLSNAIDLSSTPMTPSEWLQFADNDDFTIHLEGSLGAMSFYPNVSRGPLQDLELRRAVQMGIDPATAHTVLNSDAMDWDGNHDCIPFFLDTEYCSPGAYPEPDMEAAKQVVAEHVAAGGDNEIHMLSTSSQSATHDFYEQALAELGFEVTVDAADETQFPSLTVEGEYDAIVAHRLPFVSPFPAFFNQISNTGTNYLEHDDEEFQAALEVARDAAPEDQATAWGEVGQQIAEKGYAFWTAPSGTRPVSRAEFHTGNELTLGGGTWYPADVYFD